LSAEARGARQCQVRAWVLCIACGAISAMQERHMPPSSAAQPLNKYRGTLASLIFFGDRKHVQEMSSEPECLSELWQSHVSKKGLCTGVCVQRRTVQRRTVQRRTVHRRTVQRRTVQRRTLHRSLCPTKDSAQEAHDEPH